MGAVRSAVRKLIWIRCMLQLLLGHLSSETVCSVCRQASGLCHWLPYIRAWRAHLHTPTCFTCRPRTGRTHQIRVHLQWLGHPIANDAQYGGTYGGPVASRQLALQMGVHWSHKGEGGDGGSVKGGTAGGSQGTAAAAGATAAAAAAAAESQGASAASTAAAPAPGEGSKRQRLEDAPPLPSIAQQSAEQPAAAGSGQPAALVAAAAGEQVAAGAAAGAAEAAAAGQSGDADADAQNAAFRSEPQYRLPPELCDGLCIHCPFYAPK